MEVCKECSAEPCVCEKLCACKCHEQPLLHDKACCETCPECGAKVASGMAAHMKKH